MKLRREKGLKDTSYAKIAIECPSIPLTFNPYYSDRKASTGFPQAALIA